MVNVLSLCSTSRTSVINHPFQSCLCFLPPGSWTMGMDTFTYVIPLRDDLNVGTIAPLLKTFLNQELLTSCDMSKTHMQKKLHLL